MARNKSTRSPKRRKAASTSQLLKFPQVKGKTIEAVEIDPEAQAIVLLFEDNTALSFDLDPRLGIYPEFSDRRSGDWRTIKRWEAIYNRPTMVKWL
jgi:hypothetical protein